MAVDPLSNYIGLFGNLHRNHTAQKGYAPHKPILLLAVLDEIERGNISSNLIRVTPELVASFRAYWRALVPPEAWIERMVYPFRYLVQEGWWTLVRNGSPLDTKALGDPTTLNQLNALIDGAELAPDLWQLLQDRTAINVLRTLLLRKYFGVGDADVQPAMPTNPLEYEAEKLKSEAQSKFRAKKVSENKDDTGYFVRHALFPDVVKSLYKDSCAVCGLNVRADTGSGLIDAAHIMPFSIFHNDDPRNGIALCKNHHWGFDVGWFSVSNDYKILVSPHLQNALSYITAGVRLLPPLQEEYAPAVDALTWHRANRFRK